MIDCKGNKLNIGDEVVYIHGKNSDSRLQTGFITKFYKSYYGRDVGKATHILSHRVMKLS